METKFYMNAPCQVIRTIEGGQFAEIKLNPKYAQSMDGSEFCQGCILGPMDGAHPSHSCEDYDELISIINDQQAAIVVMVETRLLHDKPIEVIKYSALQDKVNAQQARLKEVSEITTEERLKASEYRAEQERLSKQITLSEDLAEKADRELERVLGELKQARQSYAESIKISSGNVSISGVELKKLYADSYTLNQLEMCGVDNWSFYDDARPSAEDVEEYSSSMIST